MTCAASPPSSAGSPRTSRPRGIRLGYHNHAFEFAPLDGTTVWDILLAELPPEVEIELDVYWAAFGGRDPVAEIQATAGPRPPAPHEGPRGRVRSRATPRPGRGPCRSKGSCEAGRAAGVEWYVVEQDVPRDPLVDIASAYRFLRSLAGE